MKATIIVLICSLPSIALTVGAIFLALNGIGSWGWFMVAALISNPAILGLSVND